MSLFVYDKGSQQYCKFEAVIPCYGKLFASVIAIPLPYTDTFLYFLEGCLYPLAIVSLLYSIALLFKLCKTFADLYKWCQNTYTVLYSTYSISWKDLIGVHWQEAGFIGKNL